MAEAVLFDVATSLLQKLSCPLKDEVFLLWTSKNELQKLHNTISIIKAVLQDAEQKQATDATVKTWLKRLRDEMYKADDLFDEISTRALQKRAKSGSKIAKEVRLFFSKSNHLAVLVSTAHKVKELRGRLDDVANDIRNFGFITNHTEPHRSRISRKEEWSYVKADDIIGRGKDRESIVSILKAGSDNGARVSVATIVGIGGLGKSALAQLVYNELKQDQGQFELYLWACVNDFSNMELVLQKILASGTANKCEGFQLEQLQNMLREKISGKKYLLILDDVWDEDCENWLKLKGLLEVGGIGSKILVTTRLEVVAQNLSTVKPHYYLKGLSDKDAWSLFKIFAFEPNHEEKIQKMEKIGRAIVKRCANVPLAIRTMGSFLRYKDERRWSNVLNNEIPDGNTNIMDVLRVSYDDLPSSLKHCFAYCSLFPKDHYFYTDELIHMWMAQGFLKSSDKQKSLEDVGEDNFYALLQRCFFQDVQKGYDGRIIRCKMHDLLHDLAIKVSNSDCRFVESSTDNLKEPLLHVLFDHKADLLKELPPSLLNMKGLRTLIFHTIFGKKEMPFVHQVFALRSLRVLDLRWLSMKLPSSIGNLVHLRYLNLSHNELLVRLPDSVCKLQNLQTLDVSDCCNLKKLPDGLRLLSLRHFLNDGSGLSCMPSGLKQMTSLVSLSVFVVDSASGGLRYLRDLNHLREKITIKLPGNGWKNFAEDAKESMLKMKVELMGLSTEWGEVEDAKGAPDGEEVLDHLQPPQNLKFLNLFGYPGARILIQISSLENLRCLHLSDLHAVEYMENDICPDNTQSFFPSLVELRIWNMPNLKGWWRQTIHAAGANRPTPLFPMLSDVCIWNCPELVDVPPFPRVKKLSLRFVNERLVRQSVSNSSCVVAVDGFVSTSSLSSSHETFCVLEELEIYGVKDLSSLPEEWGRRLSNLRKLEIRYCPELKTLPHAILQSLTSVEVLGIAHFTDLKLCNEEGGVDEMPLTSLKRLKGLTIGLHQLKGLHHLNALEKLCINGFNSDDADVAPTSWVLPPNLIHLEICKARRLSRFEGSFHQLSKLASLRLYCCDINFVGVIPWEVLVGLRVLSIFRIEGMKGIPEGCHYLSNLQDLNISYCTETECLPDWITRLQRLVVRGCTQLWNRYKDPSDHFRSQIELIPYVEFHEN